LIEHIRIIDKIEYQNLIKECLPFLILAVLTGNWLYLLLFSLHKFDYWLSVKEFPIDEIGPCDSKNDLTVLSFDSVKYDDPLLSSNPSESISSSL
jgi:hypothetical protein